MDKLLGKAFELKMPALAITDHNRLTGAIRFYEKAKKVGIKPIIGTEINFDRGFHLTLMCKNKEGYANLCRLLTEAYLSNRGKAPSVSKTSLSKLSSGLIALSGCRKGELPSLVKENKFEEAKKAAKYYREIFGSDYYIELMRYPCREGTSQSLYLASFAKEASMPVVATNDVHYCEVGEYRIKELLNSIDENTPVSQLEGYRTVEQYLKSSKEMERLFRDIPEAIRATEEITAKCNLELDIGKLHFPKFDIPQGETDYGYLSKLAYKEAVNKYGQLTLKIKNRLEKELTTIRKLGFCGYFLVVWDIVRWAKEHGIRCQARGSAVDSLIVYVLDISNIDPIEYDFLFERFMHPLRKEPPDIDLDIDRRRRDEVRNYVYEQYGSENVACVGTINTFMARGALRVVGKALEVPQERIDEACNGIHYFWR